MKTVYIFLSMLFISSVALGQRTQSVQTGVANEYKNAVGVRAGVGNGVSIDLSFRRTTFSTDRLQFDAGYTERDFEDDFKIDSFNFIGTYQFVFDLNSVLDFYVGPGLGVGYLDIDSQFVDVIDREFFFTGAAIAGLDLDLDLPVIFSVSVRPEYNFYGSQYEDDDKFGINVGGAIRYQFN